ncbi:MAG: hypothetical protein PHI71_15585 [Acidiphilium sp.]|nr:hypothetical protein [Acidiphilium sp.]
MNDLPSDRAAGAGADDDPVDGRAVLQDWQELWQSELRGIREDREIGEFWTQWMTFCWASFAGGSISERHDGFEYGDRRDRRAAGASAAAAAPDAGVPPLTSLAERVAALEARLAELETRSGST